MKNFKLTEESIVVDGRTLYRIECIKDFQYVRVGNKGGFVESEDNLGGEAWVGEDACVFGNARVGENAWVSGSAQVHGIAEIFGDAKVHGSAYIFGGVWRESPLQIQGTRHFVNMCSQTELSIGCQRHTLSFWKDNFKAIGEEQEYTTKEIEEYKEYIDLALKLYGELKN